MARGLTFKKRARFRKYANDAARSGIIGRKRYKHIIVGSDNLERFLIINGISALTPQEFAAMTLDSIKVSDEGIPYVHHIPQKTVGTLAANEEIRTPLVRFAFDIIKRTEFTFPILSNVFGHGGYNAKMKTMLHICKTDREVAQFNEVTRQNDYLPLYSVASSKLCRKTHVDIMNKVQIDIYAAGLHKKGSSAVNRYTLLEIKDRFALMNAAFGQEPYKVNNELEIIGE